MWPWKRAQRRQWHIYSDGHLGHGPEQHWQQLNVGILGEREDQPFIGLKPVSCLPIVSLPLLIFFPLSFSLKYLCNCLFPHSHWWWLKNISRKFWQTDSVFAHWHSILHTASYLITISIKFFCLISRSRITTTFEVFVGDGAVQNMRIWRWV